MSESPEESPGGGGQQVVHYWPAARALPAYGDPGPVSPQLPDVLLDPVQSQTLVP